MLGYTIIQIVVAVRKKKEANPYFCKEIKDKPNDITGDTIIVIPASKKIKI